MGKSHTKKPSRQDLVVVNTATVQIPLPLLSALEDAKSAFFGLCVDTGKQVLAAMMEQDRIALCGPAGQHDRERTALRAGSTESAIVLGGRRIGMRRPRARSRERGELRLPSFEAAAQEDPLGRHTLEAIASGVTMRRYGRSLEPLPEGERDRATSRSAVSRRFVALTEQRLAQVFSQPLHELDLRVVMVDGIAFREHCVLLALGIDTDGKKHPLGLWEGSTENAAVAKALLRDLVERGLPTDRALLFGIDGSKALRKAIRDVFGGLGLVQRCQLHKRRNVLEHLPRHLRPSVVRALRQAWDASSAELARRQLERLAASLEVDHPGAAASIREGLEETLTLLTLGVQGALYRTLRTTNPIENLNGSVADYTKNVKRWRGGKMILRWVGAAVVEARKRFRKIRGHQDLVRLVRALEGHEFKHGVRTEEQAA
jgi:transposase-like protein